MTTEAIWYQFSDALRGFILSKVGDRELTEDLLQDVFEKIHKKSDTFNEEGKLSSWIYSITRNAIIDYYRKKKLPKGEETDIPDLSFEPTLDPPPRDFIKCMEPFLKELPDKYRDALVKTSLEGMSQKDFAAKYGLSYTAAKSQVQRARKMVKDKIVACCDPKTDGYGNVISHKGSCHSNCGCEN